MVLELFRYRGFGKNAIMSGVDMSSSIHILNKEKFTLIPSKGSTDGLDNGPLTVEKVYIIMQ